MTTKNKENTPQNNLNGGNWTVLILLLVIFVVVCLCVHYLWKLSDIWQAVKNGK